MTFTYATSSKTQPSIPSQTDDIAATTTISSGGGGHHRDASVTVTLTPDGIYRRPGE